MLLLIGYGNPLRGDDGLGPYLAERLEQGWEVLTPLQLMPELAEPISRASRVVFIDARVGKNAGEVICELVMPQASTPPAFTHNATPKSLLYSAQNLYGYAPPAMLITIAGASFEFDIYFSPEIDAALPQIISTVKQALDKFMAANGAGATKADMALATP